MKLKKDFFVLSNNIKSDVSKWRRFIASINFGCLVILVVLVTIQFAGCVSDDVDRQDVLLAYQQALADRGPQQRIDTEGKDSNQPLDLLKPVADGISDKFEALYKVPLLPLWADQTSKTRGQHYYTLREDLAVFRVLFCIER